MEFYILTIFPKLFDSFIKNSLIKKAIEKQILKFKIINIRDFANDKHKTVDDTPYGGGSGMLLKIEPIFNALKSIVGINNLKKRLQGKKKDDFYIILLSCKGKIFNQQKAYKLSKKKKIVLICGRYEGIDERIKFFIDEEISIGKYVLTGGEIPAMVIIEASVRFLKGFLGNKDSLKDESFSILEKNHKKFYYIEYPQYTRPKIFEPFKGIKLRVPKILLSGNHKLIEEWKKKNSKIIEMKEN